MDETYHPEYEDTPLFQGSEVSKYKYSRDIHPGLLPLGFFGVHDCNAALATYTAILKELHFRAVLKVIAYLKEYIKMRFEVKTKYSEPMGDSVNHNWSEF